MRRVKTHIFHLYGKRESRESRESLFGGILFLSAALGVLSIDDNRSV